MVPRIAPEGSIRETSYYMISEAGDQETHSIGLKYS